MPPRRSTRVTAATNPPPASKAEAKKPAAKAATRAKRPTTKRPAPVEDESRTPSLTPPAKRRRATSRAATTQAAPEPAPAPREKSAPKKRVEKEQKPYFNPLPVPPDHVRPAPQLFVWGTGNFGQFGMGEDSLGEFEKPTRNKLVEEKMHDGEFGEEGAGLEAIAAGGLFTLFVDEKGTVSNRHMLSIRY